jgi:NitT/TauT family transport system substrate-binding protein
MAGEAGKALMKIAVNPATIESAPLFVAGAGHGGDVELIGGKIPLLLNGTADAATNAETQVLFYSLQQPKLRIVLTVAECSYRVIARHSRGIASPADLKGKTIGTTHHTSAHYYAVQLAAKAGVNEHDLNIVDVPQSDMPAAFERGDIDALSIWEPIAERARESAGADAIAFQDGDLFRERFNLNTTEDVLSDAARRATLVRFVRSVLAAAHHTREKPPAVWPLLAAKIDVSEATIARLWPQFRFPAVVPDDLPQLLIAEERWLALAQKRAPRPAAVLERLIDRSVLAEALAL